MNWSTDKWAVFDYAYLLDDLTPTVVYEDSVGTRKTETLNFLNTPVFNFFSSSPDAPDTSIQPDFTDLSRIYHVSTISAIFADTNNNGRNGTFSSGLEYDGEDGWTLLFSDPGFTFDPRYFGFPPDQSVDVVAGASGDPDEDNDQIFNTDFSLGRCSIPYTDYFREVYRPARTNFFMNSSGDRRYNTFKTAERYRIIIRGRNIPAPYIMKNRYEFSEITSVIDTSVNDVPAAGISTLQTMWEEAFLMVSHTPRPILDDDYSSIGIDHFPQTFWEGQQAEDFRSIITDSPGSSGEFYDYEIRLLS